MRIFIHDLDENVNLNNSISISYENIKNCVGCFNCWFKTPKKCIHKDSLRNLGETLLKCDELIIISKCVNGCYSSKVKKVLERCIGYVEPYFVIRNNKIYHKKRTNKKIKLKVYFYGDLSENDKIYAKQLVNANVKNFDAELVHLSFHLNKYDIKEVVK